MHDFPRRVFDRRYELIHEAEQARRARAARQPDCGRFARLPLTRRVAASTRTSATDQTQNWHYGRKKSGSSGRNFGFMLKI